MMPEKEIKECIKRLEKWEKKATGFLKIYYRTKLSTLYWVIGGYQKWQEYFVNAEKLSEKIKMEE